MLFYFIRSFPDAASMPAGKSVDSNLAFTPGKKSFKKLLTEQKNADKIYICCGKRLQHELLKKFKKCLTSTNSPDILYDCCGERKQHGFLKRNSKK